MQRDLVAATNGALGGGVATAAMSGVMAVAYRSGLLGQPPPERMTGVMLDAVGGRRARRGTRQLVALLLGSFLACYAAAYVYPEAWPYKEPPLAARSGSSAMGAGLPP